MPGLPGAGGLSCSVAIGADGASTFLCEDGTTATITDGPPGRPGEPCTVFEADGGVATITCPDGTSVSIGEDSPDASLPRFCPRGEVEGDYTISSSIDLALIADCTTITGTLTVLGPPTVHLPSLQRVGGLSVAGPAVRTIELERLQMIGKSGLEITADATLFALELPSLIEIDGPGYGIGGLTISENYLHILRLPRLERIAGNLDATGVDLFEVDLPLLRSVDGIMTIDAPNLRALLLSSLAQVGGLVVAGANISDFDLSALAIVNGNLQLRNMRAMDLNLGALYDVRGFLDIWTPAPTLNLGKLASAGAIYVRSPLLSHLDLPLLWRVENGLTIDGPSIERANLPALAYVGFLGVGSSIVDLQFPELLNASTIAVGGNRLKSVYLPKLTSLTESLFVQAPALETIHAPLLRTVYGTLDVSRSGIASLTLPSLTLVTRMSLSGVALRSIDMPLLESSEDLEVKDTSIVDLTFPALQTLRSLKVEGTTLTRLSLPKLSSLQYDAVIAGEALSQLDTPALSALGRLEVHHTALRQLELGALVESVETCGNCVDRFLFIHDNPALRSVRLPALEQAKGWIEVRDTTVNTVSLGALVASKSLIFPQDLTTLDLQHLETVEGSLTFGGQGSVSFPRLTTVSVSLVADAAELDLPVLTSANELDLAAPRLATLNAPALERLYTGLTVSGTVLTTLSLPSLTQVTYYVHVTNNPHLPTDQARALVAQLAGFDGRAEISGNAP